VASTGDQGFWGFAGPQYPAGSADVLAVGGVDVTSINGDGSPNEIANDNSGGGYSYDNTPPFQNVVANEAGEFAAIKINRGAPDVSWLWGPVPEVDDAGKGDPFTGTDLAPKNESSRNVRISAISKGARTC
jgi:hypothetical protein